MSQKSSDPQAISFVSQPLKRDSDDIAHSVRQEDRRYRARRLTKMLMNSLVVAHGPHGLPHRRPRMQLSGAS